MLKTRGASRDVLYADEPLALVAREDIQALEARVEDSRLKRTRLCVHRGVEDKLHEMFIVHSRATYIRPHKHLHKAESLLVLDGAADAVFFDDAGAITSVVPLADYRSGRCFFYRIGDAVYHSLVIHTETFIFKEATLGPFDKTQTTFAPWSPEEGDLEAVRAYTRELAERVRQHLGT